MKKIIWCLVVSLFTVPFLAQSQEKNLSISDLLNKYYDIKNALVNNDAATAAKSANEFAALVKSVDVKSLAANEQKVFNALQEKFTADANIISATKDIARQRTAFSGLSTNIISLRKATKTSKAAYVAYCPMKKVYWLSAEQGIKNPYYGASMLTCGSVTEAIKN